MKISKIQIKDFLGIESLDLDLQAPINIIAGENEAGKSSIRDAIQWCMTGQARGLKTHQEQAALIRNGAKAAEVNITFGDGRTVSRRKTSKSPATINGEIPDNGLSPAILCDPHTFLSLPENQRREMLFEIIPGLNPSAAEIAGQLEGLLIKQDLPAGEDTPQAAASRLAKLAANKGFQAAEPEAVAMRREVKRLRDSLAQIQEPEKTAEISGKSYVLPDIDRAEVEAALADLNRQRNKLLKHKGIYENHQKQISRLETQLADARANIPQEPDPKEVEHLEAQLQKGQSALMEIRGTIDQGEGYEILFPEFCPVFLGDKIPCPQAGKVGLSKPGLSKAEMDKLLTDRFKQENLVDELRRSLETAKTKANNYAKALSRIQAMESELARLKTETQVGPPPTMILTPRSPSWTSASITAGCCYPW